jgi:phosphoribosyl 1,2-cyclic phosphodiesterase
LRITALGSGSRGNSLLLESGDTRVLLDAGYSPRMTELRLANAGVAPESIEALIVTHEHTDHARGAAGCADKWGWRLLATTGTLSECFQLPERTPETLPSFGMFSIGAFHFQTVPISHDADEPVAVVVTARGSGARAAVVYDLGAVTDGVRQAIAEVDILVIESNHDPEMLRNGPYPAVLQRRIASRHGHLSNYAAARAAADCAHRSMSHVVLAHLSQKNNTPALATRTMARALARTNFRGMITALEQDRVSLTFSPRHATRPVPLQLALAL